MRRYALRRVLAVPFMLLGVSVILFAIMHAAPGGPEAVLMGGNLDQATAARIRANLGLDRPLPVQYVDWLLALLHGNWGNSYLTGEPVTRMIMEHLGPTLELTLVAVLVALVVAVPAGVVASVRPDSWFDRLSSAAAFAGISFPSFWLGIMLILLFASYLHWLPVEGISSITGGGIWDRLRHLILPAVTLASTQIASLLRFTRSSMMEAIQQEYVRTARAKGLTERVVIYKHALRNALLPVVTVLGLSLSFIVGGAVLIETVFAWPGVGQLAVQSVFSRDYPVIMGVNVMIAAVVIVGNLVTDLTYALIDPRIGYE
ncbi:MAG TPA: ABC transporter permease [Bacillota bacterium]|nr:ABC transporter permease [Bacillota bacterium]